MATAADHERAFRDYQRRVFGTTLPHLDETGMGLVEEDATGMVLCLPFRESLVGSPEAGLLHSGVVTTLADTACGFVAMLAWERPRSVATLDLRLDFLRPALAGRDLYARAERVQVTRQVVFARARVYQDGPERPVGLAAGTFMVTGGPEGAEPEAGTVRPQSAP